MNKYSFDSIKHLHFLTLENGEQKPLIGTTTAIGILDKPLAYWASGLAVKELGWSPINDKITKKKIARELRLPIAAQRFAEIKTLTDDEYLTLLDKGYKAHAASKDKSADKGVDLHSLLEQYILSQINGVKVPVLAEIEAFAQWSEKNGKRFLFTELHCYSEVLWCGGIADFGYIDMNGEVVLGDFKSSPVPYYSHWLQCGAYQTQLEENGGFSANGNKIFTLPKEIKYHAIFCAGKGLDKPFFNKETDKLRKAFAYAVKLYQEKIWWEDGKYVISTS